MKRSVVAIAATLASASAGFAAPPRDDLAILTAGLVAGTPVSCIQLSLARDDSRTIPHRTIAYRIGATWYVANFQGGCDQLGPSSYIITRSSTGSLCRGDIADVRDNVSQIPLGTCIYDGFTPYTRPRDQRR